MSDYRSSEKVSQRWKYVALCILGIFVVWWNVADRRTDEQKRVAKIIDELFDEQDQIQRIVESWGTPIESKGLKLCYSRDISPEVAAALLKFLTAEYEPDENGKYRSRLRGLSKDHQTYAIRFVVKKGIDTDPVAIERVRDFARLCSKQVFDGEQVEMVLLDEHLETLRVVIP